MFARAAMTATALVLLVAGVAGSAQTQQLPDLSGTWVLNQEKSDDSRELLRDMRDDTGPPAGGNTGKRRPATPRAGTTRRTPGDQPPGARDREGDLDGVRIFIRMALQPARRITITQPDSTVVLSLDGEPSLVLITDGRMRKDSLSAETPIQVSAAWEEDVHLVVTRRIDGRDLRERYSRSPETDQLIVETRLSLARGDPVAFRRVYDAATAQPARESRRPERDPPARPPRERPDRP